MLDGTGSVDGRRREPRRRAGHAVFVARGTAWSVDDADGLRILSVLVEDPLPADATHAVIGDGRARRRDRRPRVRPLRASRQRLRVGDAVRRLHPARPRARPLPQLRRGRLHPRRRGRLPCRRGERRAAAGSCFHLPARLVHSLENFGPDEMLVLGVFRPAGSPAEAYYPDGTPAAVPVES